MPTPRRLEPRQKFTLRLPHHLVAWLDQQVQNQNISRTLLIEKLILGAMNDEQR